MKVEFLSAANDEFTATVGYYNHQSDGLGIEFAIEVKRALERILRYPNAWTPISKRTRRCLLSRFPAEFHAVLQSHDC